jgi:hypothetical protein
MENSSYPSAGYQSKLSNHTNNFSANSYSSAGQQTMRPRNSPLTACPWLSWDVASEALRSVNGDVHRAKTTSASARRQQLQRLPHQAYSSLTAATARGGERIDQAPAMMNSNNYFAYIYSSAGCQSNLSNHTNNFSANSYSSVGQQTMCPRNSLLTACPWLSRDEASKALTSADGDVAMVKTASYRAAASSMAFAY